MSKVKPKGTEGRWSGRRN